MSKKKTEREKLEAEYLRMVGRLQITSPGSAANTLTQITPGADLAEIRDFIKEVVGNVNDGNLIAPESLLMSQAYTLNRVFHSQITAACKSDYIEQGQFHADMAFRAQAHCNRALKTLLEYKNPKRAMFIKQQNNLQINQASEENEKTMRSANKILEVDNESRLEPGTPEEAIGRDSSLETVEEDDRTKDG
jgi:hypothetical protein